jgi:hypothetical protein
VSRKSNKKKSLPQNDGSDWYLWIGSLNTPFPRGFPGFWADYALVINKGLLKNAAQVFSIFALANLYMVRKDLLLLRG